MTFKLMCLLLLAAAWCVDANRMKGYPFAKGFKKPANWDPNRAPQLSRISAEEAAQLPVEYDPRKAIPKCADVISRVYDQAQCGSCWAFGVNSALNDRICIQSNGTYKPYISVQDLMECSHEPIPNHNDYFSEGCGGGYPPIAYEHYVKTGIANGSFFHSNKGCKPYLFECDMVNKDCPQLDISFTCQDTCENQFDPSVEPPPFDLDGSGARKVYKDNLHFGANYHTITNGDIDTIKGEIFKNGPVTAGIAVDWAFMQYKNGIYKGPGGFQPDHAIRIFGWGEENGVKYWHIGNSWGPKWGINGTGKVKMGVASIESEISFALPKPKFY